MTDAEIGPPTLATRSPVHPIAFEIDAVQGEPLGAQPLKCLLIIPAARKCTLRRLLYTLGSSSFQQPHVQDAHVPAAATLAENLPRSGAS